MNSEFGIKKQNCHCEPKAKQSLAIIAILLTAFLSACSDYVDKIEGDYKEQFGDKEKYFENLNGVNWDLANVCKTGTWFWCVAQDDAYVTSNKGIINTHVSGDTKFSFLAVDDNSYNYSTNTLGDDLLPYLRRNGGITVGVSGSGKVDAGIVINTGDYLSELHDNNVVVAYENSCSGVKINLDIVAAKDYMWRGSQIDEGTVLYRYSGSLPTSGFQVLTINPDNLDIERGDTKWRNVEFEIDNGGNRDRFTTNISIEFSEACESSNGGLTLVGVGLVPVERSSSSSNGGSAKSSSSSNKGGTTTSGSSTEKVELAENAVTCEPEVSKIKVGESVKWKFTLSQEAFDMIPEAARMAIHSVWAFEGADKSSSAKDGPSMVSYDISYSTSGTKKATLDFKAGNFYGTFTCSTLEVVEDETASSSSSTKSSSSTAKSSSSTAKSSSSATPEPVTGFLWDGSKKLDLVKTDFGSGNKWYIFTDADTDSGSTYVSVPEVNPYDVCLGKCIGVKFGEPVGNNERQPYAGVGFDLGESGAIYDVSGWQGICIAYQSIITSQSSAELRVDLRPYDSDYYGYNIPAHTLPVNVTDDYRIENILWSEFAQRWNDTDELSGTEVAAMLRGISISLESDPNTVAYLNIYQIGSYGQCGHVNATSVDMSLFPFPESSSSSENPQVTCANDDLWCGPQGIYMVLTGLDAGDETSGYWFSYADDADGGQSKIDWPVERGNEYSPDAFDPVIDYCGGLCGTYTLTKGTLEYDPYVGVGFSIAGTKDGSSEPVPADASDWGGVCITYTADNAAGLILDLGDAKNAELASDKPFVTLGKTTVPQEKCFTWSQFKQGGWGVYKGGTTISGYEASKILVYLNFEIQAKTGTTGGFNVIRLRKNPDGINSSPFAWCGDLWCGPTDEVGRVNTGFDDYSGYWFTFNDANDLGHSYISFPADVEEDEYNNFYGPLIRAYKGIVGSVNLGEGYDYPYAGFAFNVYDEYGTGTNITDWGGVCLVYRSTLGFSIELQDESNVTDYNNYKATVAKSATISAVDFLWSDFKQGTGWGETVAQATVLSNVSRIKLTYEGAAGTSGVAEIYSIGHPGTCSRPPDYSSSSSYIFASSSSSSESNPAWEYLNPAIEYGEFTDERDGQVYKTVVIGKQVWMAQNLNYAYLAGTAELDSSSFCYNNDPDSCAKYGRSYLWSAAMDSSMVFSTTTGIGCGYYDTCSVVVPYQGICPAGWRLPSKNDWEILFNYVGDGENVGSVLKTKTGWGLILGDSYNSYNGTDDYGFSANPTAYRGGNGKYGIEADAYFWSSHQDHHTVWLRGGNNRLSVSYNGASPNEAISVRCVHDLVEKPLSGSFIDERDGRTYNFVKIGNQTWMAQNLNYATENRRCYAGLDDTASCNLYGGLYTWADAVGYSDDECGYGYNCEFESQIQGICPNGWHMPSRAEFATLAEDVGGYGGLMLKSTTGWHYWDEGYDGLDALGFNGIPTGVWTRGEYGKPDNMAYTAVYWAATETNAYEARYMLLRDRSKSIELMYEYKDNYYSVRCVQDED
ncbi:MAG: fibrobacter succinogenes major paralogous domain-containing protein [Fibrobacter sp.]|nr:fibrobacter succinogenes major paralogous domain-containing protein [Fibrobacter sp.]